MNKVNKNKKFYPVLMGAQKVLDLQFFSFPQLGAPSKGQGVLTLLLKVKLFFNSWGFQYNIKTIFPKLSYVFFFRLK